MNGIINFDCVWDLISVHGLPIFLQGIDGIHVSNNPPILVAGKINNISWDKDFMPTAFILTSSREVLVLEFGSFSAVTASFRLLGYLLFNFHHPLLMQINCCGNKSIRELPC
jgi:hypothetical protein